LLVATIKREAGYLLVFTIDEVSRAAGGTSVVMAAVPADTDAVALLPLANAAAEFVNHAGNFVAWNAWVLQAGPVAVLHQVIAEADATGLYLNENLAGTGRRYLAFHDLKIASGLGDLNCFHIRHELLRMWARQHWMLDQCRRIRKCIDPPRLARLLQFWNAHAAA
jgi:hypothetical protein